MKKGSIKWYKQANLKLNYFRIELMEKYGRANMKGNEDLDLLIDTIGLQLELN